MKSGWEASINFHTLRNVQGVRFCQPERTPTPSTAEFVSRPEASRKPFNIRTTRREVKAPLTRSRCRKRSGEAFFRGQFIIIAHETLIYMIYFEM